MPLSRVLRSVVRLERTALETLVSPILLFVACLVGALGIALALPRRGVSPQVIGALVAAGGLGIAFIALGMKSGVGSGGGGGPGGALAGVLGKLPNLNFYVFSIIALGASLRVISHPRPVYAALYFVLTILASCGLYVILGAEFMAFALVIVYAGAILITYLFVLMLATESPTADQVEALSPYDRYSREPMIATVVGFVLLAALTTMMARGTAQIAPATVYAGASRIELVPGKIETALREAGLMSADERLAREAVGNTSGHAGSHADHARHAEQRPAIELSKAGAITSVRIAYGEGQERTITSDNPLWPKNLKLSNVEGVGFALLADHPGAIEIAGIVLLMAMLGAVVLARKKVELDEVEKKLAQARSLAEEFTPQASPLMGPESSDAGSPATRGDLMGETAMTGTGQPRVGTLAGGRS